MKQNDTKICYKVYRTQENNGHLQHVGRVKASAITQSKHQPL